MGYKIITMKRQLLLYLIKLFVGIVVIIICWLALTNIFVECGVIIPANYSETILEENRKRLDDIQQITDNDLPYGSKYSIFDLDYNYERGTMNKSDIEVTKKILLGKESNLQGNYVYSVIARTEEYCVIKYNIKARFNSDNRIFNYIDYDNLSYITMVLVFLLYVYIMTLHLVSIWKNNFEKIEKITLEIEKQNLDFTYEESKIKEFSNIITALIKMRDMMANGIIVDGQEEAIIKIIKFLFDFKLNDGERDFWKGQIDFDEVVNKKLTDENIIRRDAWCYGNPGICYAIVSAGNALDNQFLIDYGIENLRLTMNNIKGIFSPTFCHGYAGLYQVLNSVEMLLQKEFFSLEKELLKNKITDFYNPDYIYGFKNMELDNKMEKIKPYDVCGLLEGTTGVCLSLLEGEKKSDNLWKKAFLLA